MKKIAFLSIIAIAAVFTACDLDVTPETEMTNTNFWKSETDLKGACNYMYQQLPGFSHDTRSDELVKTTPDGTSNGSKSVPATSSGDWTDPYKRIFTANNIIEKGSVMTIDESVRDRWMAEAYFFRAYEHFKLVAKYGDVPLVLKTFSSIDDSELKMGRTPREEVIQQCYKDLEFAIAHLPKRTQWTSADEFERRRVTRSSALGLIVRIGLHEGTMQKYHNLSTESTWKAHLKKSIDAAELLKQEGHALYADFTNLFLLEGSELTYAQNPEILFAKAYGPNGAASTTNHGNTRQMENSVSVTRQMTDLFLYADGLPKEKTTLRIANETSFNNVIGKDTNGNPVTDGSGKEIGGRDPRLAMTIWTIMQEDDPDRDRWRATGKGDYMPFTNQHGNGYTLKKGYVGELWSSNSKEYTDKLLIRYGEILISYAEALYEYNGAITDAQLNETVNALRDRVGFNQPLTNGFATANGLDMLEEIRRERTVELLDEGFRYTDIIRWKIAENVLPVALLGAKFVDSETTKQREDLANRLTDANGNLDGVSVYDQADIYVIEKANVRTFNPAKDYYYPIPTFEIAQSEGNIKQNPNW